MMNCQSAPALPALAAHARRSPPLLRVAALLLCTLLARSAWANDGHTSIWVCTDPETGAKTYTGKPRNTRNCRSTDITSSGGSGTARPSETRPAPVASSSPSSTAAGGTRSTARTASDRPAFTPESRARDTDRKQILQDELDSENRKLAELQREFNNGAPLRRPEETDNAKFADRKQRLGSELERTRINVRTLERELGRL